MRIHIHTETKALLWFAISNGVAHFYFTLLPYLTYEGARVQAALTSLSVALVCLWLLGVRLGSEKILLLMVPCGWILSYQFITAGHLITTESTAPADVVDLGRGDRLIVADFLSVLETAIAGIVFAAYLILGFKWLSAFQVKASSSRTATKLTRDLSYHSIIEPGNLASLLILYWGVTLPLSVHYWALSSSFPEQITTLESRILWANMGWLIAALSLILSGAWVFFKLRPTNLILLESAKARMIDRRWRIKVWILALVSLSLILFDILKN